MRATSFLTLSAALLLSTAALAQQTPPPSSTTTHGTAGSVAVAPRAPATNPLQQADVSKVEGVSVIGSDGKKIGDVTTALMQPQDKKIDRLVVHAGGVLGMGGRYVALPVDAFSWDGSKNAFTIAKTENDVKYMTEWKPGQPATTETGSSSEPSNRAPLPSSDAGK